MAPMYCRQQVFFSPHHKVWKEGLRWEEVPQACTTMCHIYPTDVLLFIINSLIGKSGDPINQVIIGE
jgi:hypothetical protein